MVAANCFETETARNTIMRCLEMEVNLALRFGAVKREMKIQLFQQIQCTKKATEFELSVFTCSRKLFSY